MTERRNRDRDPLPVEYVPGEDVLEQGMLAENAEVDVRRGNPYLRALWVVGVALLLLSALGFAASQVLYSPSGYSFGSSGVPALYVMLVASDRMSAPLLTGGLVSIALALASGAVGVQLARLAVSGAHRPGAGPGSAGPADADGDARPSPAADGRAFADRAFADRTSADRTDVTRSPFAPPTPPPVDHRHFMRPGTSDAEPS